MAEHDAILQPFTLKGVTFRNRVMSTGHAPAYGDNGMPGERYQAYHAEKPKGGIGLTIFGGTTTFTADAPAIEYNQLYAGTDAIIPHFQSFAERIHGHGAKLMCQLTHIGRKLPWYLDPWLAPIAPSRVREPFHRSYPKPM
jgi:2,4-dienoyl-CoA reductase-like NADH-dependent reductase (Old Yellow Enzyme family)